MAISREQQDEQDKAIEPVAEHRDRLIPPAALASPNGAELSENQLEQVSGGIAWPLVEVFDED